MFAINKLRFEQNKKLGSKLAVGDSAVCTSSSEGAFATQTGQVDVEDANLLVQIGAAGMNMSNGDQYKYQVIQSNGEEILNKPVERAVRATKLRFENDAWTLVKSDVQDTFGNTAEGTKLDSFLQSFANEELLVLSTWDEPSKNAAFKDTLKNHFGATQADKWDYRSAYAIVAKKDDVNNNGLIHEEQKMSVIEFTTALACDGTNAKNWVAECYQNRTTFLSDANLPNCLVTADFGATKECYKCEAGQTYDEKYQCITLADAETQGVCTSLTGKPAGTDECSQCDAGKGDACAEGTVLVSDGTCVPEILHCDNYECDGTCLECLNGQYLAQDQNVCVAAIPHCVDQESSGVCLNCQSDYVEVADDVCCASILNCKVQGDTCAEGCLQVCEVDQVENHNDVCVDVIEHCANQHDDGACHQCANGYQVAADNDRACVAEQPHCTECLESGDCQTCAHGHTLVTHASDLDKCVPTIPECGDYDYETGNCHGCNDAQELAQDDDVCVPQIPNCSVYQASAECFECEAEQLGLSPNTCHEEIPHCTSYTCAGACETCGYGYEQLAGQCSPTVPQCNSYSNQGDCTECTSGYTLSNSQCTDTNKCASYNCGGTCVKCLSGSTLTEYGVCTGASAPIQDNCNEEPDKCFTKCAEEEGQCECNGKIHQGADGHQVAKSATHITTCNNSILGDPISGVKKSCYCEES